MKKLYEVEPELTIYVMAEDEGEAGDVALRCFAEECGNLTKSDIGICEVGDNPVNGDWLDGYPYGDDDNGVLNGNRHDHGERTVKQIIADEKSIRDAKKEREEWEKKQQKLFE